MDRTRLYGLLICIGVVLFAFVVSCVFLIILCVYVRAYFIRPAYFNLAKIDLEQKQTFRTATITESDLAHGIRLLNEGKVDKAIGFLNSAIVQNPNIYDAYYYLGVAYLLHAKISLPGFSYKYDSRQVAEGINYLNDALMRSNDNQFYQEDCFWYLGKAYIMLGELEAASIYIEKIIKLNQMDLMRKEEAQEMISAIEGMK